eukprot:3681452-Rhodomonas_salina.1
MANLGETDAALFAELYDSISDTWADVADEKGRTPVLVAAEQVCCKPPADDASWAANKKLFDAVLNKMSARATDVLQP